MNHSLLRPPGLLAAFGACLVAAASGLAAASGAEVPPAPLDALLRQARALGATDPARSIAVARDAVALAAQTPDPIDDLLAAAQLAESLRYSSDYDGAAKVLDAALAQPAAASPGARYARALLIYGTGQIAWNRGNYVRAEETYLEVQRTAEALGEQRLLARVLNSRGIVAHRQKLHAPSEQFYRTALALAEKNGDAEVQLQVRNNLATLFTDQRRFDEARPLLLENLRTHTAANNRRSMANALINLGTLESTAGNDADALPYFERALALRLELGIPRHIASAREAVARSLARLGRADEAIAQLEAARPVVEKIASHELFVNFYRTFSEACAARGDYRGALDYLRKMQDENELFSSEKTATTITELRERFDAEKRSREIAELNAAQQKKDADLALKDAALRRTRLERYGLAALLLLGAIAAAAIIGRQRAIARAERRILAETRRARDAAEEAATLKSKLLDLASHDLKAPLVGVMMTAENIAEDAATLPEVVDQARAVRQESQRMFDLVKDLLDSSALETGDLPLRRAPLDFAALVRELHPEFELRAARKDQRVLLAVDASAPLRISGDAARLRQVIHNLVDNALKFSPAGTTVHLAVTRTADQVRLAVRDEGPGLTAEDQQHLFQRFRRLSAAPTGGESSSGLGLALTHDLVTQHGGRLWAESTPGAGATFVAEFPAV